MMDHYPSSGYSSPPPAYNEAYDGYDNAAAAVQNTATPYSSWHQEELTKESGEPSSNDGAIIPGQVSGGGDPYYPGPPAMPWAVPRGPPDGLSPGQPLRAGYFPPSGLQPAYAPQSQFIGLVPAPASFQHQPVVIIGRQQTPVQFQTIETFCGHMALACFVFWFCNILLGAVAFVLAVLASNSVVANPRGAHQLGKASYSVSVTGILTTIIVVIVVVSLVSSENTATHCAKYYYNYKCFNYFCAGCSNSHCVEVGGYYMSNGYCYYN